MNWKKSIFTIVLMVLGAGMFPLGAATPLKLATTIDYLDYAFEDGAAEFPEYYPLELWEQRLRELSEAGIEKVYLRVNACGLTLYPTRVSAPYGDEYGNHSVFWTCGAPRLIRTMERYNPLTETIRLGHKYGMEVWCWESLFDDAANWFHINRTEKPAEFAKYGCFPMMDPFFRKNPDGYAMLDPRRGVSEEEARKINQRIADKHIGAIRLRSAKPRPEAALAQMTRENLRILVSDDNINFRRYEGDFELKTSREGDRNVLEITGLDIPESYLKLVPADSFGTDFGFVVDEFRGDDLQLFAVDGERLPANWMVDALSKTVDGTITFVLVGELGWDYKRNSLGIFKGELVGEDRKPYYFHGMAEFNVPKTRQHKLERFQELLEYDFDGYIFDIRNHSRMLHPERYGYNPEVREACLKRYGFDIWKDDFDRELLLEVRADAVSDFLAECRRLAKRPLFLGASQLGLEGAQPRRYDLYGGLPWQYRKLFASGAIDGVMMMGADYPESFTPEVTGGREVVIGSFREMLDLHRSGSYDLGADLEKLAAMPKVSEVQLYEALVFTQNPEKYFPVLKAFADKQKKVAPASTGRRSGE